MARKRILASVLAVLLLLSCCFTVSAETYDSQEFFTFQIQRQTTTGSSTSTVNYDFDIRDRGNSYGVYATDNSFWSSGALKLATFFEVRGLTAGHEYELKFSAGVNFNTSYQLIVLFDGVRILDETVNGKSQLIAYSVNFTAPEVVDSNSVISVQIIIPEIQSWGADGQPACFEIGKTVDFTDRTNEPGWLGRILQSFSNLGDRISGFFTNLGNTIGGFFTDLKDSLVQKFVDLANSIGEFFDMLRDYILYFEHPVELDANGVPIGADGKPVYTNPFASKLDEFKTTVNGWLDTINGFINSIDSSRVAVAGYLSNGSTLINGVLTAVPILSVVLTFAIVFLVVRKVVGR